MKTKLILLTIAFVACGGNSSTKPGEGPGFPAGTTAASLWMDVSQKISTPNSLEDGDGHFISGTADCYTSGTARVEDSKSGTTETLKVTYTNCDDYNVTVGIDDLAVKQTGDIQAVVNLKNPDSFIGTYSYQQHVSFSGGVGFAADCDYTITSTSDTEITPDTYKIDGECTYVDSTGKELKIAGEEMTNTLFGL